MADLVIKKKVITNWKNQKRFSQYVQRLKKTKYLNIEKKKRNQKFAMDDK